MLFTLDIKYAIRQLLKSPKFTALTLLVLIGGLTISLYTFSFLHSLIYKPLPFNNGEQIYRLSISINGQGRRIPAYELLAVRAQLSSFEHIGVFDGKEMRLSIGDSGKSLSGTYIESGIFEFTQTAPILGRSFSQDDMLPQAQPTTVISYYTWQHELSGATDIIGKLITIDGQLTHVIGVMPEGYGFPINSRLWLPMSQAQRTPDISSEKYLQAYANLKPGVSVRDAELELTTAINNLYQETAKKFNKPVGKLTAHLMTFPHAQTDGDGNLVFTFFNLIAFFILLLACINVGNLLLARAIEKQKETAIRAAIGAPHHRLVLQIMWEGILITTLGGVLSLLLVGYLLDFTEIVMHSSLHDNLPFWWHWGMDFATLLMAILFTVVTLFLASFIPAKRATNQDINAVLRDGTRGAQSKSAGKASRLLVTVQVFLISTLMLVGSVSAYFSQLLVNLDTGEQLEQAISGGIYLADKKYNEPQSKTQFFSQLHQRILHRDNVEHAVLISYRGESSIQIDAQSQVNIVQLPKVSSYSLFGSTDFYSAKLIEGRRLDQRDNSNNRLAVMISESMAKTFWPNEQVIDKKITITLADQSYAVYIVGIVTNVENSVAVLFGQAQQHRIYLSGYQFPYDYYRMLFRYQGDQETAIESFYQTLFSLDKYVETDRVRPATKNLELMKKSMQLTSDGTFAAGGFALLLALTGIYGLTANTVAQRTHEIGIRRAVGATDQQVIRMFLAQGSKQVIIGLSLGLLLYTLLVFVFQGFNDNKIPMQLFIGLAAIVSIGLTSVVMAAIYFPTRRAVKMEPSEALRYE